MLKKMAEACITVSLKPVFLVVVVVLGAATLCSWTVFL